ncbi:MAG: undecaprenyl-diphosphate phosphatase [Kiritimatiellae bacterium]|nr:undecaprenyl-diphosphate phosphatase [Kiritimatiellia bacterium]
MIEITILAVLQGIAEFLPISSSGHLVLAQNLLKVNAPGMQLDIFLHLGTLISICVFYFSVIKRIVLDFDWRYVAKIIVSAIPAIVVALLFKDRLEQAFDSTEAVGVALVFTGVVLILTRTMHAGCRDNSFKSALVMGLAQALALIPGVSRSGMTLVGAKAAKVEAVKSAEFSFLMSAPLIVGASLLELIKAFSSSIGAEASNMSHLALIYGTLLSGVVGYASLKILVKTLVSKYFWLFGVYCIVVGVVCVAVG